MYGYIYKRVNALNGMTYVGLHKYISDEIKLDESYRGSGIYFKRALQLYGEENFSYELIDFAESQEELNDKEIFWIKELNTLQPNGYNIAKGGVISFSHELQVEFARMGALARGTGWTQSDNQKQTVREYMTNRVVTQETRDKISKALIGNTRALSGKGKVWVNDGVNNFRMLPNDVDTKIYSFGMIVDDNYAEQMRVKLSNRVYINKDGKEKYIKVELLESYLLDGWKLGRLLDTYKNRKWNKKGTIKIINDQNIVKYIKPEKLEEYEKMGFKRTKRD